jgi:hypothetical protein
MGRVIEVNSPHVDIPVVRICSRNQLSRGLETIVSVFVVIVGCGAVGCEAE